MSDTQYLFINTYQLCNPFYLLLLKNVLSVLPFICKKVCRLVRLVRLCMLLHIKLPRYYHLLSWDFYRVLSSLLSLYFDPCNYRITLFKTCQQLFVN